MIASAATENQRRRLQAPEAPVQREARPRRPGIVEGQFRALLGLTDMGVEDGRIRDRMLPASRWDDGDEA